MPGAFLDASFNQLAELGEQVHQVMTERGYSHVGPGSYLKVSFINTTPARTRPRYLKWRPMFIDKRPAYAPRGIGRCAISLVFDPATGTSSWWVNVNGYHVGQSSRRWQAKRMAERILAHQKYSPITTAHGASS